MDVVDFADRARGTDVASAWQPTSVKGETVGTGEGPVGDGALEEDVASLSLTLDSAPPVVAAVELASVADDAALARYSSRRFPSPQN